MQGHVIDKLLELPDESVDLIITSTPYYGLRSYGGHEVVWGDSTCEHAFGGVIERTQKGGGNEGVPEEWKRPSREAHTGGTSGSFCLKCNAWKGQLGLEPTFDLFIEHLVYIFSQCKRVLKKSGSLYLNLGDTYSGGGGNSSKYKRGPNSVVPDRPEQFPEETVPTQSVPTKSLMGIPWRTANRMVDELGWILRNAIIWKKPNHMPSSVKDRLTNSYEFLFHFVKSEKYYYDLDSIRVPHKTHENRPGGVVRTRDLDYNSKYNGKFDGRDDSEEFNSPRARTQRKRGANTGENNKEPYKDNNPHTARLTKLTGEDHPGGMISPQKRADMLGIPGGAAMNNPKGKNPDDTFQENLDNGIGVTGNRHRLRPTEGSAGYHKDGKNPEDAVVIPSETRPKEKLGVPSRFGKGDKHPTNDPRFHHPEGKNPEDYWEITTKPFPEAHFAVFPEALCMNPIKSSCPKNGIVLDPFCGSGTSLLVAAKLGRRWMGIELNIDYITIAYNRLYKAGFWHTRVPGVFEPETNFLEDYMDDYKR